MSPIHIIVSIEGNKWASENLPIKFMLEEIVNENSGDEYELTYIKANYETDQWTQYINSIHLDAKDNTYKGFIYEN